MVRLPDRVSPRPATSSGSPGSRAIDAVCGLLAAGAALGIAQLAALVVRPESAPMVVVSGAVVDLTPLAVKEWAVATFGTADKPILLAGIAAILAAAAVVLGIAARRGHGPAIVGAIVFGAIGAGAALTRPAGRLTDVMPSLLGAVTAYLVLRLLLHLSEPPVDHRVRITSSAPGPSFDRRRFVLAATATALASAGAGYAGTRRVGDQLDAEQSRAAIVLPPPATAAESLPPEADLEIDGLAPYVTPNVDFYRIDTAFSVPQLDATAWRLRLYGMGVAEREYTYAQLLDRPDLVERYITLACVSNPVGGSYVGNARWIGVPLANLLSEAGVRAPSEGGPADQLVSRSSDGMTIGTPVEDVLDGREAMLAVGMNGEPLPTEHGFPVRMVVPGLYGYVSACKWLVELELTTFDALDAYWVPRGWSRRAPIKTQSRIDTPRDGTQHESGELMIAGVAWAQTRGIEAVEVRIDDGDWRAAELAEVTSADTWRQWALRWDAAPGTHRISVRAIDGTGEEQTARLAQPAPNGASGHHTVTVTIGG